MYLFIHEFFDLINQNNYYRHLALRFLSNLYIPGEPENGVRDVGGVVALPGCPPKNPPGEAIEGGEAGEDGPPLEVFGGLMRFSFCRLLKKLMKNKKATLIAI